MQDGGGREFSAEIEAISLRYGISARHLYEQIEFEFEGPTKGSSTLRSTLSAITEALDAQVLFLPTYRRIEQELNFIIKGLDESDIRRRREALAAQRGSSTSVELIEFGMKDVEEAIDLTLRQLNTFARESLNNLTFGYLGDIVEERYAKIDFEAIRGASDQTIGNVLNRIQEHILSTKDKEHLKQIINNVKSSSVQTDHTMIICHYFIKLMAFQKELESKEALITSFCGVCNTYMTDKRFEYDIAKFSFKIISVDDSRVGQEIKLSHLSSGEKQIVSLFSHLYLSGGGKYFVLIDEPELSLSVPWQRKFLVDIHSGDFCAGLVAVTHSPFIYDNELRSYAHGLGEFASVKAR
jgi:hypothetical protein